MSAVIPSPVKNSFKIVEAPCPLCGAKTPRPLLQELEDVEDRSPGHYTISRCEQCRLVYLSRRPAAECLAQCYPAHYHVLDPARKSFVPRILYGLRLRDRYRRLRGVVPRDCHAILEIGCGDGRFLALLDQRMPSECQLTGVDLQVLPVSSGLHSRVRVIKGEFEAISLPFRYDLVVMYNVLEHVADPVAVLKKVGTQLHPGGVLIAETSNWDSLWRKAFPRHWQGLQVPRHQTHFELGSLRHTFDAAGYSVLRERYVYDPGDLSVTLCNWIVDRLKLRTPPRQVWFYFPVVLMSAPVVWMGNLLSRGSGAIEFVAQKR
jgi:SAM-dependent methyltransferase